MTKRRNPKPRAGIAGQINAAAQRDQRQRNWDQERAERIRVAGQRLRRIEARRRNLAQAIADRLLRGRPTTIVEVGPKRRRR